MYRMSAAMKSVGREHSKPFLSVHEGKSSLITVVFVLQDKTLIRHILLPARCEETLFFSHSEILLDYSMH